MCSLNVIYLSYNKLESIHFNSLSFIDLQKKKKTFIGNCFNLFNNQCVFLILISKTLGFLTQCFELGTKIMPEMSAKTCPVLLVQQKSKPVNRT